MYRLGRASRANLEGVHPEICAAVEIAIKLTEQDFCILSGGGVRTAAAAADNARRGVGVSTSLHIRQPDGYGHAVDLVAYAGGKPSWDKRHYPAIRRAMLAACDRVGLPIQHGADWDIDSITGEPGEWDWPHFQIPNLPHRVEAAREAMLARLGAR